MYLIILFDKCIMWCDAFMLVEVMFIMLIKKIDVKSILLFESNENVDHARFFIVVHFISLDHAPGVCS